MLDGTGQGHRAKLGGNIVIGVVTDNVDPKNLGRIKVKYPWLTEDHTSHWIRQSSPMGGPGRGFYFLPEVDDEVLVAFEHGDVRRPYMLGALWNGKDAPVEGNSTAVVNKQVVRRTIKTRIGHTVLLDDTDKLGEMSMTTCNKHKLTLDDKNKNILIKTKNGHQVLLDDKNKNITALTVDGRKVFLDDAGSKIVVTDKAGNSMTINSGDNSIKIECNGNFSVNAKGKVSITGTAGVEVTSPAMLKMEGSASTSLQSSGILTVQGSLVKIN